MCWACNPLCGRCKPPQKRVITCPACQMLAFFSPEEAMAGGQKACPFCGEDVTQLVRVEPVFCNVAQEHCAFPCKQYDKEPSEEPTPCAHRTPVTSPEELLV